MPQCPLSTAGPSSSVAQECDCLAHRFGNAADNGARHRRYPRMHTGAAAGLWVMDAYTLAFAVLLCSRPDGSGTASVRGAATSLDHDRAAAERAAARHPRLARHSSSSTSLSYCSPAGWCAPSGVAWTAVLRSLSSRGSCTGWWSNEPTGALVAGGRFLPAEVACRCVL